MLKDFWLEWTAWWTTTPEFAFLVALPFFVAAVAFLGDFLRIRRRRRIGKRNAVSQQSLEAPGPKRNGVG